MDRINRTTMLMDIAEVVAKRGTCSRLRVGAVFSKEGRIISTGYNGAPKGMPHCDHSQDRPIGWIIPDPTPENPVVNWRADPGRVMVVPDGQAQFTRIDAGCQVAEHAERNAIAYAARFGVALDGSEVHVTHAPCLACARTVINAGVTRVTYKIPYRITDGVELLAAAGIEVIDLGAWD